jgi:hypothetical protein
MILTPTTGPTLHSAEAVASDSAYVKKASEAVAAAKPDQGRRLKYEFERELLPLEGGQVLLHLRNRLMVDVDPATMRCGVVEWGVSLPVTEVADLPNRLARQFLTLFSKADRDSLDQAESDQWLRIIDQVDYRRFCIDRAAPQYVEGVVETKQPNFVRVRWYDDSVEKIDFPVASALNVLKKGDEFGAYVKLGLGNKAMSIERLTILSAA